MRTTLSIIFEGLDLLPACTQCKENIELVPGAPILRTIDGNIYIDQQSKHRRRMIIEGTGYVPDVWNFPTDAVFDVKSSVRFVGHIEPEHALQNTTRRVDSLHTYRSSFKMVTSSYNVKYDEFGEGSWKWQLEEA